MRIYHSKCTMNPKAVFVLLLTVLVIFGYSFYRYFYHPEKYKFQISNTVSRGKSSERNEADIERLLVETGEIKRTTPEAPTKESTEEITDSNDINFVPKTESEEKAKKELFEHLEELSRQQEINDTNQTDGSGGDETLFNENRIKEYKMDRFVNTIKPFVENAGLKEEEDRVEDRVPEIISRNSLGNEVINARKENRSSVENAGLKEEEDEVEDRAPEIISRNSLGNEVINARKKNSTDEERAEGKLQQNKSKVMSNLSESFDKDLINVRSKNSSDVWDGSAEGFTKSNEILQNLQSNGPGILSSKRGKSPVTLRKRKRKRISKKNVQNIFKPKIKTKAERTRHHGTKTNRGLKIESSLSKNDIHYKSSSLHKEGHNSKQQQHKSIHPNKKMLANLKSNFKIDYREGYVLDETFFRKATLKPFYNNRKQKKSVLLLHPSVFTSSVWVNIGTMQVLAESGYCNIAIDLPGYGRSNSSNIPYSRNEIIDYMIQLLEYFRLEKPVIVTPSRSGDYVMPLIMSHPDMLSGFVAISPTDTSKYSRHFYENLEVPSLVVLGKEDTSMLNWASLDNLEHLKTRRIFTIANATKECYVDRPSSFHKLLLDFLSSLAIDPSSE